MRNIFKKYHTVTGEWVEILFNFDDDHYFVKSPNDEIVNTFLVHKDHLIGYFHYIKLILMGEIYSPIDHLILNHIRKNNVFNVEETSSSLDLSTHFLLKNIESLSKRGFINYDYNDETKTITAELLSRGKKKFVKLFNLKFNKIGMVVLILLILNVLNINQQMGKCHETEIKIERTTYRGMIEKRMTYIESQEFNYDLFTEYLKYLGIRNINVVKSQALLETGFFTSSIFFENNNLFGMKRPYTRKTLVTGVNRGHATYNHWTESVKDYKLWYDFMTRNGSYHNYYDFLYAIGYAEDGEYIQKLKHIEERIINNNLYLAYENNN